MKINIEKNFEFHFNDVIVLGCSTGPDSMALFDMLLKIRDKYNLKLICAHVNHNMRKQSMEEAEFIKNFCIENNVVFESMIIEKYGDDNFHNEARNIRYDFFSKLVSKYNANYLMTAHHGDDLIETIMMRIVRGSHLDGYSGFHMIVDMDNYKIVRPLITYTKLELERYDVENNVKYYIDESNLKDKYTRNRYRKYILPFLKKEDQNVHIKFLKFSKNIQEASSYIKKERDKALKKVLDKKANKISISNFLEIDYFLQKEILYYIMEKYYQDDLILINDRHVELLLNMISSKRANARVNLPNEIIAVKSYDEFFLFKECEELTAYEIELGEYASLPNNRVIKKIDSTLDNDNTICRLSSNDVLLPLIVRTRKYGDKIAVKGLNGTKKVKDIFINSKVKISDRDLWPIVTDSSGKIVWIPGLKKSKFDKKKNENCDIILKYC